MTPEWQDAVDRGAVDRLEHLLTNGADIDQRDGHGQTALMLAVYQGRGELVAWLIERGATLNHTAKFGLSALMLAVIRGQVDIVRSLTDAGADLCLRGTGAPGFAAKTALDLAIARGNPEIIEILRAGAARRRL
jgi:uncharacterized protein